MSEKAKKLFILFREMFRITLFILGGGFAIIAVADEVFAKKLKWTKEGELIEQLPIFQMIPGLIAGNTAVYVGNKIAGALGAAVALAAVALPSLIIFTIVSMGYNALPLENPMLNSFFVGLRSALTGIVAATALRSFRKSSTGAYALAVAVAATVAIGYFAVNPALVLVFAMIGGILAKCVSRRAGETKKKFRSFFAIPLIFLKYGSLCFGGGYVLVPLYIQDFVGESAHYLQLGIDEFSNLMALTQMTPGPIGINAATFFGYRLGGIAGAIIATVCLLLPGYFILLAVLKGIERFKTSKIVQGILFGVRPATVALILCALWSFMAMSIWSTGVNAHTSWCTFSCLNINPIALTLALATAILSYLKLVPVMRLVLACAIISLALAA